MIVLSLWKGLVEARRYSRAAIRRAVEEVAAKHAVPMRELTGPAKHRSLAYIRQEAMWSARQTTGASFPEIGRVLNRDHTTVIHGVRAHAARIGA